jgi:hypothetical protein
MEAIVIKKWGKGYLATLGGMCCFGKTPEEAKVKMQKFLKDLGLSEPEATPRADTVQKSLDSMLDALRDASDSMFDAYQLDELTPQDIAFLTEQPEKPDEPR